MHLAVCEDSRVSLFETINAAIRCTTDIFRWGGVKSAGISLP